MSTIKITEDGLYPLNNDMNTSETTVYVGAIPDGTTISIGFLDPDGNWSPFPDSIMESYTPKHVSHGHDVNLIVLADTVTAQVVVTARKEGIGNIEGLLKQISDNTDSPIKEDAPPTGLPYRRVTNATTGQSYWENDPIRYDAPVDQYSVRYNGAWVEGMSKTGILNETAERVRFRGEYRFQEYQPNDMVLDEGWVMIANNITYDKAAPRGTGTYTTFYPADHTFVSTSSHAGVVHSGVAFTATQGVWVKEIDVFVPELSSDTNYRIVSEITSVSGEFKRTEVNDPLLIEDSWKEVLLGSSIIPKGTQVKLYVDALTSSDTTSYAIKWIWGGDENDAPATGYMSRDKDNKLLISTTDAESNDVSSELASIIAGTKMVISESTDSTNFRTYTINAPGTNNGTHYVFEDIDKDNDGGGGSNLGGEGYEVTNNIDVPIPLTTQYSEEIDYWANNSSEWADVKGYLAIDGQNGVLNNNGYGINIVTELADISEDWDYVTTTNNIAIDDSGSDISPAIRTTAAFDNTVKTVTIGEFSTTETQTPAGEGAANAITVHYGDGGTTSNGEFTVDSDGVITCHKNHIEYEFGLVLRLQRQGGGGVSHVVARMLYAPDGVNFVQYGDTFGVKIDDSDTVWRETFESKLSPAVGSKIKVEFARDQQSSNSGEIGTFQPSGTLSDWNPIPSARLRIKKTLV